MDLKQKRLETIYVTLDVLLDTRLGTLARISDTAASVALATDYHTRDQDIFTGVDMEKYRWHYRARDLETLKLSACTAGIQLLRHLVGSLTEQAIARPYHDGCRVVVNTAPYLLDSEDTLEIGRAVASWMQGIAPVDMISVPDLYLTPDYCRSEYAMMLMYEYEEWMNIQAKNFETSRMSDVSVFVPALYFGAKPTKAELAELDENAPHPLRAIEMLASPLVDLKLIDVKYFSILKPTA